MTYVLGEFEERKLTRSLCLTLSLRCGHIPKHATPIHIIVIVIVIVIYFCINIEELKTPIIIPFPTLLSLSPSLLFPFILCFLLCRRHLFLLSNNGNEASPLPSNTILQPNPHPFLLHQLTKRPLSLPLPPLNTRSRFMQIRSP